MRIEDYSLLACPLQFIMQGLVVVDYLQECSTLSYHRAAKTRTYNYGKIRTKRIRCHVIPLPKDISQMIMAYAKPGFNQRIYQLPESVTRVYIDNLNIVFSIEEKVQFYFRVIQSVQEEGMNC